MCKHTRSSCLSCAGLMLAAAFVASSSAGAQTTPFLFRPYYGAFPGWNAHFDHKFPDYNGTISQNNQGVGTFVRYTGESAASTPGSCPSGANFCYDGHSGVDFNLVYKPIVASASGTVEYAGWASTNHDADLGLMVRINHNNNHRTLYGHLSMVRYFAGANVGQWQVGTGGTTGFSSGPHLHFEVQVLTGGVWKVKDAYGWSGAYTDPWRDKGGVISEWLFVPNPLQSPPSYNGNYEVDDGTANFSTGCAAGGSCPFWWTINTAGASGDLRYTFANGTTADYWARWQAPNLPTTGQYEIEAFIPNWDVTTRSHATRYEICHNTGCTTVVVDQHDVGYPNFSGTGQWISLGRYNFNAGSAAYVRATDAAFIADYSDPTSKKILVDALRWRKTH